MTAGAHVPGAAQRERLDLVLELMADDRVRTIREIAGELGIGLAAAGDACRTLAQLGDLERVPSEPGSRYPIAGWRLAAGLR